MSHGRLATAAVCLLPLVLAACGDQTPADPRTDPPLVRVATLTAANQSARSFTGTIGARVQSDLGFRVGGKVLERLVETGQTVRRGQALMRLDPVDLRLAVSAQQEAVTAARARAQQAAEDEARFRDLKGTGAISASAYDQAKAASDAAQAQLRAAEAQADVARNASRYTELVADADGVVVDTMAEPGQVVPAGQPVVRLAQAGSREAVVQLPETLRPSVGSSATASLYGQEDVTVAAKLRQISGAADRLTRTFEARYQLEGALASAPLGATVTVRIPDGRSKTPEQLSVPVGALLDKGNAPGVWVITGQPAIVSWKRVVVHGIDDETARISGGVRSGDRVVSLGAHLLTDGSAVRIESKPAAAPVAGGRP
ncbi:MAG: efflux RND transporter periplasmic adaptor subunit [Pelomonas sp.]|nr:efflux RND transporter periplasmic adaptor subunit [Roseateles sp.]